MKKTRQYHIPGVRRWLIFNLSATLLIILLYLLVILADKYPIP